MMSSGSKKQTKKTKRRKKSAPLRILAAPFVVAPRSGQRIRTRLHLTVEEAAVLTDVGTLMGMLAGRDLAARCAAGSGHKHEGRAARKRALTAETSSRWAGAITRRSDDQWQMALDNLYRERNGLRDAISAIERRCSIPVGGAEKHGKVEVKGYATQGIRYAKQQRLLVLGDRLAKVEARIAARRVAVVRGGRKLLMNRANLEAAGLTEAQWRTQWEASRLLICADGEKGKLWGNETIQGSRSASFA